MEQQKRDQIRQQLVDHGVSTAAYDEVQRRMAQQQRKEGIYSGGRTSKFVAPSKKYKTLRK